LILLQQQRYSDTTTNDEGKMDVCGAEDRRSSSGSQVPADGRDCFEDSQK
jgi:hypothetical protein